MSDLNGALHALWLRHRATIFARVDTVERAVAAVRARTLDDALRDEAIREAHKLAGSLGSFGMHDATAPARALEEELAAAAPDVARMEASLRTLRSTLERAPAA